MSQFMDEAARMGAEATLITSEAQRTLVSFEFNRLKKVENSESFNLNLQVIKNGRLGVANSTKLGSEKTLLGKALAVSEFGSTVNYEFPAPEPHSNARIFFDDVADISLNDMISLGEEIVNFIKPLHPAIQGRAGIGKNVSRRSVENTRGLRAAWRKTSFTISAGFQLVEGQSMLDTWYWEGSCSGKYDPDEIKRRIREDFEIGRKNESIESGLYDVLFTPLGLSSIIHPIVACLDGRAVMRGISPLKDRLGEKVFAPSFSLIEDGVLDDVPGSQLYDDQGVACRRTKLIDKGILREYLLDLESAHKLGRRPIGAGSPQGANPNNLLIAPGDTHWDDLLKGIKRGIVIDQTMGTWAGNPYTGTVSGNVSLGFLVIDGKKVGRVKDCMFSLNVFNHLKSNLLGLSKEIQNTGDGILPYCLVEGVSIATKGS